MRMAAVARRIPAFCTQRCRYRSKCGAVAV